MLLLPSLEWWLERRECWVERGETAEGGKRDIPSVLERVNVLPDSHGESRDSPSSPFFPSLKDSFVYYHVSTSPAYTLLLCVCEEKERATPALRLKTFNISLINLQLEEAEERRMCEKKSMIIKGKAPGLLHIHHFFLNPIFLSCSLLIRHPIMILSSFLSIDSPFLLCLIHRNVSLSSPLSLHTSSVPPFQILQ